MSAQRCVPYRESSVTLSIVGGVLRAWLFGFRCLTADMLDQGDIAFKSAAGTHGVSRKSRASAATGCVAIRASGPREPQGHERGE